MVTKEEALNEREFHWGECVKYIGPRGGERIRQQVWRRNGQTKTWKRYPEEFKVPLKWGLRSYTYLTNEDAQDWHAASACVMKEVHTSGEDERDSRQGRVSSSVRESEES